MQEKLDPMPEKPELKPVEIFKGVIALEDQTALISITSQSRLDYYLCQYLYSLPPRFPSTLYHHSTYSPIIPFPIFSLLRHKLMR